MDIGPKNAVAAPQPETVIRSIISDLNYAVNRIAEISGRTGSIGDRLGGPTPEAPLNRTVSALTSVPTNIGDELRGLLARAQEHLSECEQRLSRIESFV